MAASFSVDSHIVSHAVNMAIHSFYRPMIVGHDSIEASFTRLKHYLGVPASLQRRRSPDEASEMAASFSVDSHIVSHAVNVAIHSFYRPMIVGHDSIEASFARLKHYFGVPASLQRRR
eukprot:scaffold6175_cov103-Skeletonema_marinoi.AAC.4